MWHGERERAALLPPALWHSLFFCQCVSACVCGRLLINTYVHISNIFASVCCQFAAASLFLLPAIAPELLTNSQTLCHNLLSFFSPPFFAIFLCKFSAFHVDFWAWVGFSASRFRRFLGLANAKHFLRLRLSMRNFLCVCAQRK